MKFSKYKKAVFALIICDTIWGAGPPIFKWSFINVHPFTLAFLRFLIPTLLLAFFARKHLKPKTKDIFIIFLVGLTNITLNIGFYFIAILNTPSINAPIIASAAPIFLILGSVLFLNEKPAKKVLLGNCIGLTGILLIVLQPLLGYAKSASIIGNILLIFSTIASVIGTLLAKKIMHRYEPITIAFWSFAVGTITFFPFFLSESSRYGLLHNLSFQGLTGIFWGSIFSSLAGYFLLYWSLQYIPASEVSVFSYIDPIAAILIAIPLLHEYPTPIFILGSLLVIFGVYVAEGRLHYHPLRKLLARE